MPAVEIEDEICTDCGRRGPLICDETGRCIECGSGRVVPVSDLSDGDLDALQERWRSGHIQPDMTLTKAEIKADREAWKEMEDEIERLRAACLLAADLIDRNLYHQREKVRDAASILRQALAD